jgi:hypothetical protein
MAQGKLPRAIMISQLLFYNIKNYGQQLFIVLPVYKIGNQ